MQSPTHLDVPTYLLFALEALLSVSRTVVPETIIMRLPTSNMNTIDMGGQTITRVEDQLAVFPLTCVSARTCVIACNNRGQRFDVITMRRHLSRRTEILTECGRSCLCGALFFRVFRQRTVVRMCIWNLEPEMVVHKVGGEFFNIVIR